MDSPVKEVLETSELLELILLNLPLVDIFVYQRISKTWLAVAQRSIPAQRRMYLLADDSPLNSSLTQQNIDHDKLRPAYEAGSVRLNPALTFNRYGNGNSYHLGACYGRYDGKASAFAHYNIFHWKSHIAISSEVMPFFNNTFTDYLAKGSHNASSSWRSMLITQPRVTSGNFHHFGLRDYKTKGQVCTIFNSAGVTFGALYDWWWKFADEGKALRGKNLGCRSDGMACCLVLPFNDDEINKVLRRCDAK